MEENPLDDYSDGSQVNYLHWNLNRKLEDLESVMMELQDEIPFEVVRTFHDNINKTRHELYAALFCKTNSLGYSGTDVNPVQVVKKFLMANELDNLFESLEYNLTLPKYRHLDKTPDLVLCRIDEEGQPIVTIVDFSVSVDPRRAAHDKIVKYEPYIKLFNMCKVGILITIAQPTMGDEFREYIGQREEFLNTDFENAKELFERSEDLKRQVKARMSDDDKRRLEEGFKSRNEDDMSDEKTLSFKVSWREFEEKVESSKGWKEFLNSLEDREAMGKTLLELIDPDHEIPEASAMKVFDVNGRFDRKELQVHLEEKFRSLEQKAKTHVSRKCPSRPDEFQLVSGFENVEEKAKNSYSSLQKGKILTPVPYYFSVNGHKEVRKDLKHARLNRLLKALEAIEKKDPLVEGLKKLLKFASLSDDEYEKFKKGEFVYMSDGSKKNRKDFIKELDENNKKKQKMLVEGSTGIEFHKEYEKGIISGISMKKGEVIIVRPSGTREIKELLMAAGVGIKEMFDKDHLKSTTVESLPFWEEDSRERYSSQFEDVTNTFMREVTIIGERVERLKRPTPEPLEHSSSSSSSDESVKKDEEEKQKENFLNGLEVVGRNQELMYENLAFVSKMANSGFRIVQGNTPNAFIITMPSESIFKGESTIPFINVVLCEKGDIYNNLGGDDMSYFSSKHGTVKITMGRRLSRNLVTGYLRAKSMFDVAKESINHYLTLSKEENLSRKEMSRLFLFCQNININTSSLLDNFRYMIELTMADYSCVEEFMTEKLLVPTKNTLQMFLYKRLRDVMPQLHESMKEVKTRTPTVDQDGSIDMTKSRITDGSFPSVMFPGKMYTKPEHLISEVQALFFAVPKGLHGRYHNIVEIHKTPLKIQQGIDLNYRGKKFCVENVEERLQYNPYFMIKTAQLAEQSTIMPSNRIRENIVKNEGMNDHPLTNRTLASTRSTLVKVKDDGCSDDNLDLDENISLAKLKDDVKTEVLQRIQNAEAKMVRSTDKREVRKIWRSSVKKILSIIPSSEKDARDLITNSLRINKNTGRLMMSHMASRNNWRGKAKDVMKEQGNPRPAFYTSSVVLSEVLESKTVEKEEYTITGELSRKSVLGRATWKVGIRPKGQRTQKDREIYVGDMEMKMGLYPIEHSYKQVCMALPEEKISEAGDLKIITLNNQVKSAYRWLYQKQMSARDHKKRLMEIYYSLDPKVDWAEFSSEDEFNEYKMNLAKQRLEAEIRQKSATEQSTRKKPLVLNFNLDMTKWAPHDNLFKFIWTSASSNIFTMEEKLYFILALMKLYEKEIYIDEEILVKSYNSNKKLENNPDERTEKCVFKVGTEGFKNNLVEVKHTWLQGQLNYISSFVHAGAMLYWENLLKEMFGLNIKIQINVHSDDNQMTVCLIIDEDTDEERVIKMFWNKLDFCAKNVCIEVSTKKSYISKMIKQFISQYNFAGEQVYLWIKSAMSAISGTPFTTLKDDTSSVLSKVSEALSKGCPKKVASIILKRAMGHIHSVYGIRDKDGTNKFAKLLHVPEENLPTCLGGFSVKDYTSLAMGGPRIVDQMIIMDLLRNYGATISDAPRRAVNLTKSESKERSLRLIIALDYLSQEAVEDDDPHGTFSTTLNPFRSIKFQNRRTYGKEPFSQRSPEERERMIKSIKDYSPGLVFFKPKSPQDLVKYYYLLYQNPTFRSSLAGQSPDMLMLMKVANRHNGIFKMVKQGDVNEKGETPKFEKDDERNLLEGPKNPKQIAELLDGVMAKVGITYIELNKLWAKYLHSDPEFRVMQYVRENCEKSTAIIRPNPEPKKKPEFQSYSKILNPVAFLLVHWFDEGLFQRSGMKLPYPGLVRYDYLHLSQIFPAEFCTLRWLAKEDPAKYTNFRVMVQEMSQGQRKNVSQKEKSILTGTLEQRMTSDLSDGLIMEPTVRSLEDFYKFTMAEVKLVEKVQENLHDRLLKMSRAFKSSTKKVVFCPPYPGMDIHEMALTLRQYIESSGRTCLTYTLRASQTQHAKESMMLNSKDDLMKIKEFCMMLANFYTVCVRIGMPTVQIRSALESCSAWGKDVRDIEDRFKHLPRHVQTRVMVPLSCLYPANIEKYIISVEPITFNWIQAESGEEGGFHLVLRGGNFRIEMEGYRKRVKSLKVGYSGDYPAEDITQALRSAYADILMGSRFRTNGLILGKFLPVKERDMNIDYDKGTIYYSPLTDSITRKTSKRATMTVSGTANRDLSIAPNARRFDSFDISEDLMSIEYMEGSSMNVLRHHDYKRQGMGRLEVHGDPMFAGFKLRKLLNGPVFKAILDDSVDLLKASLILEACSVPGSLVMSVGTSVAMSFFEICTYQLEGQFARDSRRVLDQVEECIQYGEEGAEMVQFPEYQDERYTYHLKKEEYWKEVRSVKEKMRLRNAYSVFEIIDIMSVDEISGEVSFSTDQFFEIANALREVESKETNRKWDLKSLYEGSGHDYFEYTDKVQCSTYLSFMIQMFMNDRTKLNRVVETIFRVELNRSLYMDVVEVCCYYFADNALLGTFQLGKWDTNEMRKMFVDMENDFKRERMVLSSFTIGLRAFVCKVWEGFSMREAVASTFKFKAAFGGASKKHQKNLRQQGKDMTSVDKSISLLGPRYVKGRLSMKESLEVFDNTRGVNSGIESDTSAASAYSENEAEQRQEFVKTMTRNLGKQPSGRYLKAVTEQFRRKNEEEKYWENVLEQQSSDTDRSEEEVGPPRQEFLDLGDMEIDLGDLDF